MNGGDHRSGHACVFTAAQHKLQPKRSLFRNTARVPYGIFTSYLGLFQGRRVSCASLCLPWSFLRDLRLKVNSRFFFFFCQSTLFIFMAANPLAVSVPVDQLVFLPAVFCLSPGFLYSPNLSLYLTVTHFVSLCVTHSLYLPVDRPIGRNWL